MSNNFDAVFGGLTAEIIVLAGEVRDLNSQVDGLKSQSKSKRVQMCPSYKISRFRQRATETPVEKAARLAMKSQMKSLRTEWLSEIVS